MNDFEKIEELVGDFIVDGNVYAKFKQIITGILQERDQLKAENAELKQPITYLADLQMQIHSLKDFNTRQAEEIKQLRAQIDSGIIPCTVCIWYDRQNCCCVKGAPRKHNTIGCEYGKRGIIIK